MKPSTFSLANDEAPEGLFVDLQTLRKRQSLHWLMGGAVASLVGCGGGSSAAASTGNTGNTGGTGTCSVIPQETAGPYPGDGSNTAAGAATSNVLSLANVTRSNITSSISGYGSATATGVPLTVNLSLKSVSSNCQTALAGYAVYLWHCDALGRYSLYSSGVVSETYLRGLQVADSNGQVSFTSIFPGCYSGRWPHIHFEVFTSAAAATRGTPTTPTSQLALPEAICRSVYADSRYPSSLNSLNGVSLTSDNVFSNGSSLQLASVSGTVASGLVCSLNVYL